MRSFEEIIKDCQDNKDNKIKFNKYFNELLQTKEVNKMIQRLQNNNTLYCFYNKFYIDKGIIENRIRDALFFNLPNWKEEIYNLNFHYKDIKRKAKDLLFSELSKADKIEYRNYQIICNYNKEHPEHSKDANFDDNMILNKIIQDYKKEHPEYAALDDNIILNKIGYSMHEILSLDAQNNSADDSSSTFLDMQKSDDYLEEHAEKNIKKRKIEDLRIALKNIKIEDDWSIFVIYQICYSENIFSDRKDLAKKLYELTKNKVIVILPQQINKVDKLIKICEQKDPKNLGAIIDSRFSPSVYAEIINYLIKITAKNDEKEDQSVEVKENNQEEEKLQVEKIHLEKLILDFNKIRNYLSVLLNNDDIKDKKSFIKKSKLGSVSSYEKESRRILDLFKPKGNFFELKDELKEYKPGEFLKIYDIHTVPNIVINFLILHIFQKFKEKDSIKIQDLIKELFFKNKKFNDNHIKTFRKYTLLKRINEMNEYGFINKIDNDKYSLKARVLDNIQKNALKYAVPFFCAVYPFSSIGHFLANRLDIDDKFAIEPYNISNILEDCIAYDLLYAINNKEDINPVFKNKDNIETFSPKELLIDNKKGLLKVRDNKKEYYLHEIDEINFKNKDNDFNIKSQNPIFSEIYSFYYKVFEDAIKIYKQVHDENEVCKEITKPGSKSKSKYNLILDYSDLKSLLMPQNPDKNGTGENKNNIRPSILKIMANIEGIENVSIPLTTLELRWLKTIMQDPRFELFVTKEEKQCLKELVDDVEVFDLSAFKVYDYNEKKYTNIINKTLIKNINKMDKEKFRKQLKELNSIPYSLKDNCFPETNKY